MQVEYYEQICTEQNGLYSDFALRTYVSIV